MKEFRPDPPSGGPLDAAPDPRPSADGPRYEVGGLLGRGGMGEVHIARDPQLGRDVALKTPRRQDASAAAQLSREASLTALLEHPNIVPIYGVGSDADGEPWCAMRLLPGRSLADAFREAPDRMRLLRHLLDAAEAIAYAHGRGVLHRDLKPANIMVGGFGETVVTDWGLACFLHEAAQTPPGVGTPGYMSPEQQRGGTLDGRADVYGLGAVLFELLTGEPPPEEGIVPTVRAIAPLASPELAAIADKALRADREARYPTMRALADDLLAWFEGRQVAAHAYTVRELLTRQLSAWRVPITIGVIGLLALMLAIGIGVARNSRERARAQASEKRALAASAAAERALADALLAQAQTAAGIDRRMEAEIFAVNALVRNPTPEARGVMAHFGGRPRLSIVGESVALPDCPRRAVSIAGDRVLCGDTDGVRLYDLAAPDRPIATTKGLFEAITFAGDSQRTVLADSAGGLWLWEPPADPTRFDFPPIYTPQFGDARTPGLVPLVLRSSDVILDIDARTFSRLNTCGPFQSATHVTIAPTGERLVSCSSRRLFRLAPDGAPHELAVVSEQDGTPFTIAAMDDGRLLVGTVRGILLVYSAEGALLERREIGTDAIAQFAIKGQWVAMGTGHGEVAIWSGAKGQILARHVATDATLAWVGDKPLLRFVGDVLVDREIPHGYRPHLVRLPAGVAALAVAPNGLLAAVGMGDGSVSLISLVTGEILNSWRWQQGVTKDVVFSPDGTRLGVATVGGEQRVLELSSGRTLVSLPNLASKRAAWLRSGWFLLLPYYPFLPMWRGLPVGDPQLRLEKAFGEIEANGDGTSAAMLDELAGVWRLDDGDPPTLRHIGEVPRTLAAAPLGDDTLVTDETALLRLDSSGRLISRIPTPMIATDVAVSADERLFALGHIDGTVTLWRVGEAAPVARLIGHTARVGSLAFSPDGAWLVTSSWDASVRVWSLAELDEPAEVLLERVTAEWGYSLEQALAGVN